MIGVGTFSTSDRMRELVNQVLDTNRISYGPMSRRFERLFSEIHEVDFAVLSNSGTSSLHVALQAMKELHGWPDGAEVIIPGVTFVATANVVLHNRLTPVAIDVRDDTYNMDAGKLLNALNYCQHPVAIIPVHLFGQPADVEAMQDAIEYAVNTYPHVNDVKILEDSCECMFASHHDRIVGGLGDAAGFSTYVAHLVSTGVGGISTTNNPDLAAKMRSLVNHGRDGIYISIDDNGGKEVIDRRFKFRSIGHSFRITELEAALGVAQLEDWETMIGQRQANAAYLTEQLRGLEEAGYLQLPRVMPYNTHSWMMYPIVLRDEEKWELCYHLEQFGVETREMLPLTNQPVYQHIKTMSDERLPVTRWINRSGFYVGVHQDLEQHELDKIASVMHDYWS